MGVHVRKARSTVKFKISWPNRQDNSKPRANESKMLIPFVVYETESEKSARLKKEKELAEAHEKRIATTPHPLSATVINASNICATTICSMDLIPEGSRIRINKE